MKSESKRFICKQHDLFGDDYDDQLSESNIQPPGNDGVRHSNRCDGHNQNLTHRVHEG
jgi:hypothetical protein